MALSFGTGGEKHDEKKKIVSARTCFPCACRSIHGSMSVESERTGAGRYEDTDYRHRWKRDEKDHLEYGKRRDEL